MTSLVCALCNYPTSLKMWDFLNIPHVIPGDHGRDILLVTIHACHNHHVVRTLQDAALTTARQKNSIGTSIHVSRTGLYRANWHPLGRGMSEGVKALVQWLRTSLLAEAFSFESVNLVWMKCSFKSGVHALTDACIISYKLFLSIPFETVQPSWTDYRF